MRRTQLLTAILATVVAAAPFAAPVLAAQQLTLGQVTSGATDGNEPAIFTFTAEAAGVLTVVVRGKNEVDLTITVTDSLGQPLPDGNSDRDLGGDVGAEQAAVVIPGAGDYQVRIGTWGGGGLFDIAAGFVPFPALARAPDPDGLPTAAADLVPGAPIEDQIDPSNGDGWDWFKVTAESAGVITVITEAPEGDLVLEVFAEGEFGEAVNRSDQDMQGVTGNESLTVNAAAGQTFYFKVTPAFETADAIPYRIRAGIM